MSGLVITGMTLVPKHPLAQPKRLSILFCPISRGDISHQCMTRWRSAEACWRMMAAGAAGGGVPTARGGSLAREPDVSLIGTVDGASPVIHPSAWVAPDAVVVGRVTLGRSASIWYGAVLRADSSEIVVGPECNVQDHCCLHVDDGEPVLLAERVSLGHRATVHGAQVETGALIGIGAIVLGRARVGAGALVAARRGPGDLRRYAGSLRRPGCAAPRGILGVISEIPETAVRGSEKRETATYAGIIRQHC